MQHIPYWWCRWYRWVPKFSPYGSVCCWLAAPVLLAPADVTENIEYFKWIQNLGTPRYQPERFHYVSHGMDQQRAAERTGATARVTRRRRERLTQAGRGMRTSRSNTRAAAPGLKLILQLAASVARTTCACAVYIFGIVGVAMAVNQYVVLILRKDATWLRSDRAQPPTVAYR